MPKEFSIEIDGTRLTAELLEQEAPRLAQRFWDCLPTVSFGVHAKFAGQEMIVMVPFFAEPEHEILEVKPGDIGYYPGRQTICIFYGDTMPFGQVSVFARLTGPLEKAHILGEHLVRDGMLPAKLERVMV